MAVLSSGVYQVAVGAITAQCHEEDLTLLPKGQGDKSRALSSVRSKAPDPARKTKRPPYKMTVDLHGMRVEEALRLVEQKVNEALMNEIDVLEVVHGVGTGKLKDAIHRYLADLSVVKEYKLDPVKLGATWVYF